MPEPLRPLSFGQLIDAAARLVWLYPALLVGLALLPVVVFVPMIALLPDVGTLTASDGGASAMEALLPSLPGLVAGGLLMALLASILWPVGMAGLTYAAAQARLGQAPRFGTAWRIGWKRLWPIGWALTLIAALLLGIVLLVFALAWAGGGGAIGALVAIAGCVASAFVAMHLVLILPVVVLEQRFGVAGLQRSAALMRGHIVRALGLFVVVNVALYVASALLAAALGTVPLVGPTASLLLQLLAQGIGGAVVGVLALLLYLDVRCRAEGLDLEQLAQLVAAAAPPA